MTSEKTVHTSSRQPNYGVAAIGFFLAASCFFLAAAFTGDLAPWFIGTGGLNVMNGCLLGRRFRKAAAQHT